MLQLEQDLFLLRKQRKARGESTGIPFLSPIIPRSSNLTGFLENIVKQKRFIKIALHIVADAVCGFNAVHLKLLICTGVACFRVETVFAYGQTNSGKTHTMRGSLTEPSVIPLAVHDLFEIIQEIYNEDINDLLAPERQKLQIHDNLERGIHVAGLREEIVASPQQVLDLMEFGDFHRHIGETKMNKYSSRSHTIFCMIIESRCRTKVDAINNSGGVVRVSILNFVDLAGSERALKTGAKGVQLKEASYINKSLMALGTVIKKLSEEAKSQGCHVPYRDSKLTHILQPALGENIHADETKSSLQFASRAKCVSNFACVNEIVTDATLLKCQKEEFEELQAKLPENEVVALQAELVKETEVGDESCEQEDCNIPDLLAFVTNRRKVPLRKRSSFVENKELVAMQEFVNETKHKDCNIPNPLAFVTNRRKVPFRKRSTFVVFTMPFTELVFG
ncbi:hypothetical protein Q3G72_011039 [Acer saccharum]|nr:hypothetical protein Q3G72_011039 [Acer saccharum]